MKTELLTGKNQVSDILRNEIRSHFSIRVLPDTVLNRVLFIDQKLSGKRKYAEIYRVLNKNLKPYDKLVLCQIINWYHESYDVLRIHASYN